MNHRNTRLKNPLIRDRALVAKHAWRMRIPEYASRMSQGAWIKFKWICYVLLQIQFLISKPKARIIVNAPPQHGKSEGISHWLPTWYLDWWPENNVILGSYEHTFATQWGLKVRNEFTDNPLTWTRIHKDHSRADDWWTTEGGGMRCAGIDSGFTGRGFHLGIIDDPYKGLQEALSPTIQKKVIDWFNWIFYTRRSQNAGILVNHTRWNTKDLTQYLIDEHQDNWTVIKLPAIAHEYDPIGRTVGEPLCPELHDYVDLMKTKSSGSLLWSSLYDQDPKSFEGNIVKRKDFKRINVIPDRLDRVIHVWDLTFDNNGPSFVCGEAWGQIGPNYYLLDLIRDKLDIIETVSAVKEFVGRWPQAKAKLIEKKANGAAVIKILNPYISGLIPYEPTGKGSKTVRLVAVQGLIEAGNVHVPNTSWGDEFIDEVVAFPKSAATDQMDCMTMALDYLDSSRSISNIKIPDVGVRTSPWDFARIS